MTGMPPLAINDEIFRLDHRYVAHACSLENPCGYRIAFRVQIRTSCPIVASNLLHREKLDIGRYQFHRQHGHEDQHDGNEQETRSWSDHVVAIAWDVYDAWCLLIE